MGDDGFLTTALPARYAFVVQLSHDSDPGRNRYAGQIEHILSGHQGRFTTHEEMLTFMQEHLQRNRDQEA